jgi:hypothetical protein
MRGEKPYAVDARRNVGLKLELASWVTAFSTLTFETPYGVTGLNAASSARNLSPDAP